KNEMPANYPDNEKFAGEMNGRAYPNMKDSIILCLLFLGIQVGLGIVILVLRMLATVLQIDILSFIGTLNALCNIVAFGIVLFIGFKKSKRKFNEIFKFNKVPLFSWISIVIFMLGFVIVISELDNILNYLLPMPEMFKNLFESLVTEQAFIAVLITAAIVPAFTEELFFRGLVLDGFNRNYTPQKAILVSALLFGIIHLNPWQFFGGFIVGLFAAWVCIKANSIWLSIYIHLFNNALFTITMRYRDFIPVRGFNTSDAVSIEFQPLWFDILGLVLSAIGILLFKKSVSGKAKNGACG
ncbi:MAG: CPBP family intramembrane metalloprotease, partial [Tannerella sp.]|nr:CPBP family intramembrane metalloprotease [Tannerella sp.]